MVSRKLKIFSFILAAVVFLDFIVKYLLVRSGTSKSIIGDFFQIAISHNFGAGFGIMQGQRIILVFVSFIAICLMVYYYKEADSAYLQCSISLLLGGTISNLADRLTLGYVIDYIRLSFWPSFNIADAAITLGGVMLVYHLVRKG